MSVTSTLPHWNMEVVFPGLSSPEFIAESTSLGQDLAALERDFGVWGIDKGGSAPLARLDDVFARVNALLDRIETMTAYVTCFTSTDSRNDLARAAESELDLQLNVMRKLLKRMTAWLGDIDLESALAISPAVKAHEYIVLRAREAARHLMSPAEEALASDMELTGSIAWAKLYGTVTSQIEVPFVLDGEPTTLPISAVRALASHADRAVRQAAYEAELAAWKANEAPIAAALNGIKGQTLTLCDRRGWKSPLESACFDTGIDEETLTAMMTAAEESFPMFRRFFNAKARALGIERLAFYDIFAPLPTSDGEWNWEAATTFVAEQFDRYSPKLGNFARRNFAEGWIDAEPRPGKVDGAYCTGLRRDESRILMNFKSTIDSVKTLAHELGHGYHCLCLNGKTALQRETPMTLAETASIFCETIVQNAVLEFGTDAEKLAILEASLTGAAQVVVDITSRFRFESAVFERRRQRELAPREFCELMLDAQATTYGEGLDENLRHPYMWAAKPHYYGSSFYNFPYMFGLLFAVGLYAEYRKAPEGFHDRYDTLLASVSLKDARTLAAEFGIDLRSPAFWRASLGQLGAQIEQFERLIG